MPGRDGTGPNNRGQGRHRNAISAGLGGQCRCPNCGHSQPHKLATPCYHEKCPKCGAPLTRA